MWVRCKGDELFKSSQIVDTHRPEQRFYLEGVDGSLVLETTFDEMTVKARIPAEVRKEGRITLFTPLETFKTISEEIGQAEVVLRFDEGGDVLSISAPDKTFSLFGRSVDRRSPSNGEMEPKGVRKAVLESGELLDGLKKTLFAVGRDLASLKSRFFAGLLLELEDDGYTLVGCDGVRMAIVRVGRSNLLKERCEFKAEHAIPFTYCEKLIEVLELLPSQRVHIAQSEREVIFDLDDVQLRCGLIPEGYPDYREAIPKGDENLTVIKVNRGRLISALRCAEQLAPQRTKAVRLEISDETLRIRTASEEMGRADCRVPIEREGDDITVVVDAGMLLENLSHTEADEISIELRGPLSPILLRLEPNYSVIFMPRTPLGSPDEGDI